MLTYTPSGPTSTGDHLVTYPTPGCGVPTVACVCRTPEQAETEAARLNKEQVVRELAIQRERELCGFRRIRSPEAK